MYIPQGDRGHGRRGREMGDSKLQERCRGTKLHGLKEKE